MTNSAGTEREPKLSKAETEAIQREIETGSALLKNGVSPEELHAQFMATGRDERAAAALVQLSQQLGREEVKARRLAKGIVVGMVAAPVLIGLAIWGLVSALKGPSPWDVQANAAESIAGLCETTSRSVGVVRTDQGPVLVQGEVFGRYAGLVEADDPGYMELISPDGEIIADRVLCTTADRNDGIHCDGYFTEEELAFLENASSTDEAVEQALSAGRAGDYAMMNSLLGGGRSMRLHGLDVRAAVYDIDSGAELTSMSVQLQDDCPDEWIDATWSSSDRTWVDDGDVQDLLAQTLGI